MDASDNVSGGGISFHPLVAANADSIFAGAGGLNFDLPMAAIQQIQNNSLAFVGTTANMNYSFLGSVIGAGDSLVGGTVSQATGVNLTAINAGYSLGSQVATNAFNATVDVATLQTNLSKYLSDNATTIALSGQAAQESTTKAQSKNSMTGNIVKFLTGDFF